MIPKLKKKKKSTIKKKAWSEFSKYIRQTLSQKNGYGVCYTCGKRKHWTELQCGHGIGGRNNAILFEERLVRLQCAGCNIFGRGQYAIFTRKLIDEYGLEEYDRLVKQSTTLKKLTEKDLEDIYQKYKQMNIALQNNISIYDSMI